MSLDTKKILKKNKKDVVVNDIDGDIVMVSIDTGEYYSLDDVGNRIWELIDGKRDIESILDELFLEYDATESEIKEHTLKLLTEFIDKRLIISEDG